MNTINEICTWLRSYAYECGGGHHANIDIQKDLLLKADELQDIGYQLVDLAKQVQEYTGVTDIHYRTHLKVQSTAKRGEQNDTQIPSAERTGKWIRTRTIMHDGELYCDQCGQEHPEQKIIWNFCPNCGASMVRGEEE